MDSLSLTGRISKSARMLREVRLSQGMGPTVRVLTRVVRRKAGIALRGLLSFHRMSRVRQALHAARQRSPEAFPQLAIAVTGGVGDMVVIARFVRDVEAAIGGMTFDIFCPKPEMAAPIFEVVPGFRAAYHDILFTPLHGDYDVALRVNQMAVVYGEAASWPILRHHPSLVALVKALSEARKGVDDLVAQHPYRDNALARLAVFQGRRRFDFLHAMAGISYGGDTLPVAGDGSVLSRFGLQPGRYITVHNGFDPDFVISGRRATKCYPHFDTAVARIRASRPDLTVVQLGRSVTSQTLPSCDLNLLDRTSMREVIGLLTGSAQHLDNEGGLVHLARSVGTRAVVVFGPTPSDYFGYPGNINIDPPTCGGCWWMTRSWMDHCGKGFQQPRCMEEQDPDLVAARFLDALAAFGDMSLHSYAIQELHA